MAAALVGAGDPAAAQLRGSVSDDEPVARPVEGPGVYGEPYADALQLPEPGPLPTPRRDDEDPYAPLGIRAGSFLLFPSLEARLGYSDNIFYSTTDPQSGSYLRLIPELTMQSDWSRHELRGRIAGAHKSFIDGDGDETTDVDAEASARIDITETTEAGLRVSYLLAPESRGDPAVPSGVLNPPDLEVWTGEGHIARQFARLRMTLRGGEEHVSYDDATLASGGVVDNGDRSYRLRYGSVRGSYEIREGLSVFAETGLNERVYDRAVDDNGVRRGSDGYEALAGLEFDMTDLLTGEVGAGYQNQRPDDPSLPAIAGLMFRGSLVWRPTALTTVRLAGSIEPTETIIDADASGARLYSAEIGVDHALRRNLILSGTLGYALAEYVGSTREETSYEAVAGLEYRASRTLSFILEAAHAQFETNRPGEDYDDTRIEVGVKVRR